MGNPVFPVHQHGSDPGDAVSLGIHQQFPEKMAGLNQTGGIQKKKIIRSACGSGFIQGGIQVFRVCDRQGGGQPGPGCGRLQIRQTIATACFISAEKNDLNGSLPGKVIPEACSASDGNCGTCKSLRSGFRFRGPGRGIQAAVQMLPAD